MKILKIRIQSANHGFFAQLTYVLNQLLYCERENLTPIVIFDKEFYNGPNPYYDSRYGENGWEYFFYPVSNIDYKKFNNHKPDNIMELSNAELSHLNTRCAKSIYNYPYGYYKDKIKYDEKWYTRQRSQANRVITKYIKIKPDILEAVDTFVNRYMKGFNVLGVHMRGTDKRIVDDHPLLAKIIPPKKYKPLIDRYICNHPNCKIFVATDQQQFLEEIKSYYPDILCTNSQRSLTRGRYSNIFQKPEGGGYQKGKDVLVDALLLSRCDFLLKCTSAVGEYAIYFNPKLQAIDLNHYYITNFQFILYNLMLWFGKTVPVRLLRKIKAYCMSHR